MKKMKVFLCFIVSAICLTITMNVMAQDSTAVALAQQGIASASTKWPIVAKIVGVMAVVSELLALVPQKIIKANSVVQMAYNWIEAIFKKK